jgi:hypothetical protein
MFEGQWHKHAAQLFYPGPGGLEPNGTDVASSVQEFLQVLNKAAAAYLAQRSAGPPNYVHLFSIAQTIEDDLSAELFNPAVGDFADNISRQTETLWKSFKDCPWSGTRCDRLASLAQHSQVFVESEIIDQLS